MLTVTATDSSGTAVTASVTVTVKAANGAPTARVDSVFGRAGRTLRAGVVANDADPEGDIDPWSLRVAAPAAPGAAAASGPLPCIDVVVYEVRDRFLQCTSAEFVVVSLDDR